MEENEGLREDESVFCECKLLQLTKNSIISPWDDFTSCKKESGCQSKGKKQALLGRSCRYGYETLEDKYKFVHHENHSLYINDYSNIFLSSNRSRKKSIKTVLASKALNALPPRHRNVHLPLRAISPTNSCSVINISEEPQLQKLHTTLESEDDLGIEEIDECDLVIKSHDPSHGQSRDQSHDRVNHTMSNPAQLDREKDKILDESEDDPSVELSSLPAEPLLNRLNTFFMSRIQRKQTASSQVMRKNGFFPYINPSSYRTENQPVEMTPASIINYKIPSKPTIQPSNSICKLSTKNFQIMTQNLLRQPTQTNDLNLIRVTSQSTNQQPASKQSTNQNKFQQLSLRPREPNQSPAKLALHVKSLTKLERCGNAGGRSTPQLKPSSSSSSRETETLTQQSLIQSMIDAYRRRGITHPHFAKFEQMRGSQAPKVELFDYSSLYLPAHMRH